MIAITHEQLMKLRPCSERAIAVTRGMGGRKAWTQPADCARLREAGATLDDLTWLATELSAKDADIARRMRRWLADCAARVLHVYELHHDSAAPRNAIIALRQFARGEIDDAAMAAARAAARAAAWDAAWAGDAAWVAAWDVAQEAALAAAWAAECAWQFDRLIARMSESEPGDWPLPERQMVDAE